MPEDPYSRYDPENLTLRDRLAIDRTILANVRTILAYVRTALALIVIGVTFLHFLKALAAQVTGYAFIASGGVVLAVGAVQFARMKGRLGEIRVAPPPVDSRIEG